MKFSDRARNGRVAVIVCAHIRSYYYKIIDKVAKGLIWVSLIIRIILINISFIASKSYFYDSTLRSNLRLHVRWWELAVD